MAKQALCMLIVVSVLCAVSSAATADWGFIPPPWQNTSQRLVELPEIVKMRAEMEKTGGRLDAVSYENADGDQVTALFMVLPTATKATLRGWEAGARKGAFNRGREVSYARSELATMITADQVVMLDGRERHIRRLAGRSANGTGHAVQMSCSGTAAACASLLASLVLAPDRLVALDGEQTPYDLGRKIGYFLGVLVAVALAVSLMRRFR